VGGIECPTLAVQEGGCDGVVELDLVGRLDVVILDSGAVRRLNANQAENQRISLHPKVEDGVRQNTAEVVECSGGLDEVGLWRVS
jgi:hypothetical protein